MTTKTQKEQGRLLSQCPKCLAVSVLFPSDKYGPRQQTSIVLFDKLKKEECPNCKEN